MLEKKPEGIVERFAETFNKVKPKNDNELLKESVKDFPQLKESQAIEGQQILTTSYIRAYTITIHEEDSTKNLVAFIYSTLNSEVLNFLVTAAKKDTINGLIGGNEHCYLVKEFKSGMAVPVTPQNQEKKK